MISLFIIVLVTCIMYYSYLCPIFMNKNINKRKYFTSSINRTLYNPNYPYTNHHYPNYNPNFSYVPPSHGNPNNQEDKNNKRVVFGLLVLFVLMIFFLITQIIFTEFFMNDTIKTSQWAFNFVNAPEVVISSNDGKFFEIIDQVMLIDNFAYAYMRPVFYINTGLSTQCLFYITFFSLTLQLAFLPLYYAIVLRFVVYFLSFKEKYFFDLIVPITILCSYFFILMVSRLLYKIDLLRNYYEIHTSLFQFSIRYEYYTTTYVLISIIVLTMLYAYCSHVSVYNFKYFSINVFYVLLFIVLVFPISDIFSSILLFAIITYIFYTLFFIYQYGGINKILDETG